MIKKLLPLIFLFLGAGVGGAVGLFVRPEPVAMVEAPEEAKEVSEPKEEEQTSDFQYVRMNNQFVVPVVEAEEVRALVVLSLSLEVPAGQQEVIYAREPKLRDSFLRVLFDHANVGGFSGAFTSASNLDALRTALREIAKKDLGDSVSDVLIVEIARQDY